MRKWMLPVFFWLSATSTAWAYSDRPIRIGVVEQASSVILSANAPSGCYDGPQEIARFEPDATFSVSVATEGMAIALPDGSQVTSRGPIRFRPEAPTTNTRAFIGKRAYRGELEVRALNASLTVVDELPLEEYLYGVVPSEAIPSWGLDALKAQAVAARTYAVSHLGQFASLGYDLKATVVSQAYGGAGVEKPSTTRAVDETEGQILTYHGQPIEAYYSDSAGGYTEACADVWGHAVPYLQAVPDFDQQSPRYVWQYQVPAAKLTSAIARLKIGDLRDITITERSYSGRVKQARLVGSLGSTLVTGEKLRFAFGLRSTFFNVGHAPDGSFLFAGRGWGHGVGMSQWGAKGMADMGYTYDQILAHYYPETSLVTWDGASPTAAIFK